MKMIYMIGFAVIGLVVGMMAWMFTSNLKGFKRVVVIALAVLFIGGGLTGGEYLEGERDEELWNNGYCDCGGEWNFSNAEHRKNAGTYYYWYCDECGRVIGLHRNFRKSIDK